MIDVILDTLRLIGLVALFLALVQLLLDEIGPK